MCGRASCRRADRTLAGIICSRARGLHTGLSLCGGFVRYASRRLRRDLPVTSVRPPRVLVVGAGTRFLSAMSYYTIRFTNAMAGRFPVAVIPMRQLICHVLVSRALTRWFSDNKARVRSPCRSAGRSRLVLGAKPPAGPQQPEEVEAGRRRLPVVDRFGAPHIPRHCDSGTVAGASIVVEFTRCSTAARSEFRSPGHGSGYWVGPSSDSRRPSWSIPTPIENRSRSGTASGRDPASAFPSGRSITTSTIRGRRVRLGRLSAPPPPAPSIFSTSASFAPTRDSKISSRPSTSSTRKRWGATG